MKLYTMQETKKLLNVTRMTLLSWEQKGKLHPVRTPGGTRRYREEEIHSLLGETTEESIGRVYVYCRVSTKKQEQSGNLQRQKERLVYHCHTKGYTVVKVFEEVASGINENRKELKAMFGSLESVERIVVEYPDRLARFGYRYIEMLCALAGVELETVEKNAVQEPDKEMVEDLIAIITSFSARLYGARGGRKIKKCLSELERERGANDENHN